MYMHVHTYIYIHYTCMHVHLFYYIFMYTHVHVCMHAYICIYTYVYIYICVYMYMYICIYIYIYICFTFTSAPMHHPGRSRARRKVRVAARMLHRSFFIASTNFARPFDPRLNDRISERPTVAVLLLQLKWCQNVMTSEVTPEVTSELIMSEVV